ncbi:30S ribosomal protein S8 [Candidatus Falkowbacteria bacterium]|nr:30S ribosomal protein S8 [Candidatus Falkowbacteria bacterium]
MTMTDPIADMLTRIRNALSARKDEVLVPFSNIKFAVAKILEKERYLDKVVTSEESGFKSLKIALKYNDKKPAINDIRRVSKAGQRIFVKKEQLPRVLNNYGLAIISTSKGVMTEREARKLGLGGEVICTVF